MDAFGRNRIVPDSLGTVSKMVNTSTFFEKVEDQSKILRANSSETTLFTVLLYCLAQLTSVRQNYEPERLLLRM